MKYLYKYPQAAYPYADLIETNRHSAARRRSMNCWTPASSTRIVTSTYLLNTSRPDRTTWAYESVLPTADPKMPKLHLLPTLWLRNTWSREEGASKKPSLSGHQTEGVSVISAHHVDPLFKQSFSDSGLYCKEGPDLRFTENENNNEKLFGGQNAFP
jgi:hypothetical protein